MSSLKLYRECSLVAMILLSLLMTIAFSPKAIAQELTVVGTGSGTLDSQKQAGRRYVRLDFSPLADAEHTITVSWDSDADLRFRVLRANGTAVSSTIRGQNPGVWQGELEADEQYYVGIWSVDGVASYVASVEAPADPVDLSITAQPADQTVIEGESVTFTVEAVGSGMLDYQWFANDMVISDGTNSTLNLGTVNVDLSGTVYSVRITDDNGSITSNEATLEVTSTSVEFVGSGTIDSNRQAGSRYVRIDFDSLGAAEHTVTVSWDSDADVRYRVLQANGTVVSSNTIRGSNPGVWQGELEADEQYYIGLWSVDGVAGYLATVEALTDSVDTIDLSISAQPADQTVDEGESVAFTVEAVGSGTLSYQWFADGTMIPGATDRTFNVGAVSPGDSGTEYSVEITDDNSSVVSNAATLTVINAAPVNPIPENLEALWTMNELAGASVITDASGNGHDGTIGTEVVTGDADKGATSYRWLFASPTESYRPERIVTIPHDSALDPGTGDYSITMRYRTNVPFGNIIQKGQGGSAGGYWKIENPAGILTCVFRGVKPGGGWNRKEVVSSSPLNDGEYHTITCERVGTTLRLIVDGVLDDTENNSFGSIRNNQPISIGGKTNCDNLPDGISCDYFTGWIDEISISAP